MATQTQNFDSVTAPSIAGLGLTFSGSSWQTSTAHPASGANGLVNSLTDSGAAYSAAFTAIASSADIEFEADIYFDGSTPTAYIVLGGNNTALATGYVLEVQPNGANTGRVRLTRNGGPTNTLADLTGAFVATATHYKARIKRVGTTLTGYLIRVSDGFYLQTGGTFSATVAACLTATDSTLTAAGYSGVIVYQGVGERVYFDDFSETPVVSTTVIDADDAAIHYSPGVVRLPGDGTAVLQEKPTEARTRFTGPQISASIDVSDLIDLGTTALPLDVWPNLYWEVDGGARSSAYLLQPPDTGTIVTVEIATGLTDTTHTLKLIYEEQSGQDTYNQTLRVTLTHFVVASGKTLLAPTGDIADKDAAILFGDSITWGSQGLPVGGNPYFEGFPYFLAADLGLDLGVVGKPGQGILHNNAGAPIAAGPLGKDSFPNYYTGEPRDFPANLKYAFLAWGTNDTSDITSTVSATIAALRAKVGPDCKIAYLIPPNDVRASEIQAGVTASGDALARAVSCGATYTTTDGTHPNAAGHEAIGHGYAAATLASFADVPPSSLTAGILSGPASITKSRLNGFTFTAATGATGTVQYQAQRKKTADATWTDVSGATASPFDVRNLLPDTEYMVRVRAQDDLDTVYTNAITATTDEAPAPPAPGGGDEMAAFPGTPAFFEDVTYDEEIPYPFAMYGIAAAAAGTVNILMRNGQEYLATIAGPANIQIEAVKILSDGTDIAEEDLKIARR